VIAVGPGGRDEKGEIVPLDVKAGDRVLFGKRSGSRARKAMLGDIIPILTSTSRGCAQIRSQIEETTSDYGREKLQERLAKLAAGVAMIPAGRGLRHLLADHHQGDGRREAQEGNPGQCRAAAWAA
jgi:hypothetical protein